MTISEGAVLEGGEMALSGEGDAFGHARRYRRSAGRELERITGTGIILQVLAYQWSGP